MKKILCFILIAVLSLGVLTSCDQIGGAWDSISGTVGGFIDGILGNDQQPAGPTLEDAANFLNDIYKDKNATTRTDFDVVGRVIVNGVTFPVTWASDNEAVTVRPSTKTGYYTVDLPDVNGAEFNYTLTATITDAEGNTTTKSYTFTVPVIDNSGITSTPVEGVAYKLFLLQGSENRRYYALNTTQNNENKFINTTLDPKAGAEFYVERVDGGYKIYTEVNGVKTYMYAKVTRTEDATTGTVKYSKYIGFNAEEGSVFTYSETKGGVWTVTVDSLVYGVGTYGSYTTISISDESYFTPEKVGSSQFVLQFMTAEHANTLEEDKLPDSPSDAEGILNQLYALADGESATGEFTITGKIIELDSYNNPTIVVEGFESQPVYCYYLSVTNAVGDTITVTATGMKNYNGTYEFTGCTLIGSGNNGGSTGGDEVVDGTTYKIADFCTTTITDTTDISTADGVITFKLVSNNMASNRAGQIRVYQGKSGVLAFSKAVEGITLTANGKDASETTVTISVSNDGVNFTEVATFTASSSANHTVELGGAYTYVKIASTEKQLQITSITLDFAE